MSFQSTDRVCESGQLILHEYLRDRSAVQSHITVCVYFCALTVLNVHNKKNQQKFQVLPCIAQEPCEEAQLTKIKKMSEEVKRKSIKVIRRSERSIALPCFSSENTECLGGFQQEGHLSLEPDEFNSNKSLLFCGCGFISFMHYQVLQSLCRQDMSWFWLLAPQCYPSVQFYFFKNQV